MDDPKGERSKEFKRTKGKDGWPEVGKEEKLQEEERKGGNGGRNERRRKEMDG